MCVYEGASVHACLSALGVKRSGVQCHFSRSAENAVSGNLRRAHTDTNRVQQSLGMMSDYRKKREDKNDAGKNDNRAGEGERERYCYCKTYSCFVGI